MTNELDHKPIVGDDGELLEADSHVDMVIYYDYAADEFPPPTRLERLRYFATNNPIAWLIVLIVAIISLSVMWLSPPNESPLDDTKIPLGMALVSTLESVPSLQPEATSSPATESTPTETTIISPPSSIISTMKKVDFQLPARGDSSDLSLRLNVTTIRWSPDGKYLALQQDSNVVALWDLNKNQFLYYGSPASNIDWSPSDGYLYLTIHRIINAHQNPLVTTIPIPIVSKNLHPTSLQQPPFLQNGLPQLLVTSSQNQTALLSADGLSFSIVDPNQPDWLVTRKLDSPAHDLDWTPNGTWLSAVTETAIWKWLPESAAFLVMEGHYQQASWSLDATEIAVTQDIIQNDLHQPSISVFNPYKHKLKWTQPLVPSTKSIKYLNDFNVEVAWSPDGKRIVTFIQNDTAIDLWDAQTGKRLPRFYSNRAITSIDWSPDGKYLAIGSGSNITIWSPQ